MAHVVIAGAGPAGASLAYLLARRGLGVTLLERQTDFAREFRGEGLMPSGVEALGAMGLGAALDALPQTRIETLDIFRGARRVLRVRPQDLGAPRCATWSASASAWSACASTPPRAAARSGATS